MDDHEYVGDDDSDRKSPSAIDFYDINELCEDAEETNGTNASPSDDSDSDTMSDSFPLNSSSLPIFNADLIIPGKPLASVIPEKYLNVDIRKFYPEFQDGCVLKFQRLFGPGKPSNMPDIWRSVRKRIEIEKSKKYERNSSKQIEKNADILEVEPDEEIKFLNHKVCCGSHLSVAKDNSDKKKLNNAWRFGPAQLWYDMVSLPEDVVTYDYGFKVKSADSIEDSHEDRSEDSFLMLAQDSWEDTVIWDGDDIKEGVLKNLYSSNKTAGWLPIDSDRTVESYNERVKFTSSQSASTLYSQHGVNKRHLNMGLSEAKVQSIFPEENKKLLYDRWEDDVIWDSDAMVRISHPKLLEINDRNGILEIPDEKPLPEEPSELTKDRKDRKYRPPLKLNDDEEKPVSIKQDFYNVSNDEYYNVKLTQDAALKLSSGGSLLQHSISAVELRTPYFPTCIGPVRLRRFHRPTLKQYSHGLLSEIGFHSVHSLTKHIKRKQKQRLKELEESGGGEMFFMRTPDDISCKDSELVLFEFSEEHPPLMSQIGMASKIRNYYRRRPGKDTTITNYKYGEIAYVSTSPFLGSLQPGQSVQAYENNLFRSPIFEHTIQDTDFIIIRTRNKLFIREVETIYTVGQELPLTEVPTPKSEKANNFIKDLINMVIYLQFWKSPDNPRKIKMEDIRKAFPLHREFSLRRRLNLCADFQRTGYDSRFWVLKPNFRLPPEDEVRQSISPERYCAYFSMLAAEQRLRDAGYGDKFQFMANEETDDLQMKMDDEIKAAPWNTTQAFFSAMRGKCLLELLGVADPTGCDEGFSFVKVPSNPQWLKDECNLQNPAKRLVKGTDADLRRLPVANAKKMLKTFGVPDHEIKSMTRWQIIDVVRTLSTEQAKLGEEGMTKFARGNIFSQAEHQKKYKEECQRLFDLQNRVLSSNEVLSTDEESSSEEDSSEEMAKRIENVLLNKTTIKDLSHECEEAQRKELQKMMSANSPDDSQNNKSDSDIQGKILKIYRTFRNTDGSEYVRIEMVRRPEVVKLYIKIRSTKNKDDIKSYSLDETQKEEFRREKRRIQDQLRRIKRNELKERTDFKEPPHNKKIKIDPGNAFKVKCGACGAAGHMRTNRACPLYQLSPSLPPIQVAMTEEQEEAQERLACLDDQKAVKLVETKMTLSRNFIAKSDKIRRQAVCLKIPRNVFASKQKRGQDITRRDYLSAPKYVNRKRIDPVVSISVIFENLLNELKNLEDTQPFCFPVTSKVYQFIIHKPMDLGTMRDKVRKQQYKSREDFLTDLTLIVDNCKLFNGARSCLSITAKKMVDYCLKCFSDKEEKLMQLEKSINPLLEDDQIAFSFMLETIVNEHLKTVPDSWPFHKSVDKRVVKAYYDVIKTPMDLDSIIKNCKANKYKTRSQFLEDVQLIHANSLSFNGPTNPYTKITQQIVDACHVSLEMYDEQLDRFESGIQASDTNGSAVNDHHSTSDHRTKRKRKLSAINSHDSAEDTATKSVNIDSFIDVESFDANPEYSGTGNNSVDRSDNEVIDVESFDANPEYSGTGNNSADRSDNEVDVMGIYQPQDSNSAYSSSPIVNCDPENHDSASPTYFSQSLSLFPVNGVHKIDGIDNSPTDIIQPFSQSTYANICDDLMLSDSDSDEDAPVEDELKF